MESRLWKLIILQYLINTNDQIINMTSIVLNYLRLSITLYQIIYVDIYLTHKGIDGNMKVNR